MSPAAFGMPLSQLGETNQLPELTLFSQVLVVCATMRKACQLPNNQRRHCYCGNGAAKGSARLALPPEIVTIALI